jgi:hypothetical protein
MSRHPALFSWKKTNQQQNQQKAMNDPTATARRSVADRKNSSRPKPDRQHRRQEELQRAEARQAAEEEERRPQEAENKPFWNRFLTKLRARDS